MDNVLSYLIKSSVPLITKAELARLVDHSPHQWADYVDTIRGSVITNPGMVRLQLAKAAGLAVLSIMQDIAVFCTRFL